MTMLLLSYQYVRSMCALTSKVSMIAIGLRRQNRSGEWWKCWSTRDTTSPALTKTWPCWSFIALSNWDSLWFPFAFLHATAHSAEPWRPSVIPLFLVGDVWHGSAHQLPSFSGWSCPGCPCRSAASTLSSTSPRTCFAQGWGAVARTPVKVTAVGHWWHVTRRPGSWRVWWAGARVAPTKTSMVSTPEWAISWTGSQTWWPLINTGCRQKDKSNVFSHKREESFGFYMIKSWMNFELNAVRNNCVDAGSIQANRQKKSIPITFLYKF